MTATQTAAPMLAEEDALRADFYDLLATLLARPPSAELLAACGRMVGGEGEMGRAVDALARLARTVTADAARREYEALFIGLGRGEVLPYASYYMTGFLNEKPLASLRAEMAALGAERSESTKDPEDHIASLCEIMAGLIRGRYAGVVPLSRQREFFNRHMAPWAGHVFGDIEKASSAALYAPVGAMGRLFVEIEKTAFKLEA
jgi:TorA maturation chaperone TorD